MRKIKKPIYEPPELQQENMTEEEKALDNHKRTLHKIRERKIKKAFKALRFRSLKNFMFWFFGVMSSVGIILGSIFIGVKVIPISTYSKWAGIDSSEYVSEQIAGKSLFDAIKSMDQYTIGDVPVIEKFVKDLLEETGADDFVVVDYDAIKDVKFMNAKNDSDLIDEISACIKLSPEIEMFKNVKAYTEHQSTENPLVREGSSWVAKDGKNLNLYCYTDEFARSTIYYDVVANGKISPAIANLTETQMKQINFYFKPLTELPILEIVNGISSVMDMLDVDDVISLISDENEVNPIIKKLFDGQSLGSIVSETFDFEALLNNFVLADIEDFDTLVGDIGPALKLNVWEEVDANDKPNVSSGKITVDDDGNFTSNPKLYYYLVGGTHGTDTAVYERAFDDDGKRVLAVSDSTTLYYANISKTPVLELADIIFDSLGRIKVDELLKSFDEDVISPDNFLIELFEGVSINELTTDFDFEGLLNKITLDSFGGAETLGALGELSVFNTWEIVEDGDKPVISSGKITVDSDGEFTYNPKLYYYLVSGTHGTDTAVYERAFDDNGVRVQGVDDNTTLYYANLSFVGISDMTNLLGDSVSRLKIIELLEVLGAEFSDDDLVSSILGDKTFAEIDDISADDILLTSVMNYTENATVYKILLEATGKSVYGKTETEIEQMADELYLSSLSNTSFDIANISLTAVLDGPTAENPNTNKQLYDILTSALSLSDKNGDGKIDFKDIKVSDLSSFTPNKITLTSVLPEYDDKGTVITSDDVDNRELYNILKDVTGQTDASKITLESLSNFNVGKIKLTTVLTQTDKNKQMFDILLDAIVVEDGQKPTKYEDITVSHLSNVNIQNVGLSAVLDINSNQNLYNILLQALTITDDNGVKITNPTASQIKIKHLSSFSTANVSLSTVMNGNINTVLKEVLCQACNTDNFDDIKVSNLTDGFDFGKVELATVMTKTDGSYGNEIIDAILSKSTESDPVTLNNIGDKINSLTLYEVYGKTCFTTNKDESIDKNVAIENARTFIFDETQNAFIHKDYDELGDNTVYYIHENDGIWLLICFTSEDYGDSYSGSNWVDTDGRPEKYVISESTLEDLHSVDMFQGLFTETTIRQFVDAGIIDDGNGFEPLTYVLTLNELLEEFDSLVKQQG